jgi:hypothetical protein
MVEGPDPQIDLADLETADLNIAIEAEQGEIMELFGQQPVVSVGKLGEPVVGDHEDARLVRGQVIKA